MTPSCIAGVEQTCRFVKPPPEMGATSFAENAGGKHTLLTDVSVEAFFESYAQQMGFVWD